MVTVIPTAPELGLMAVIVGAPPPAVPLITVKLLGEVADPPCVTTEIGPVVAPTGTATVSAVDVISVAIAGCPLNMISGEAEKVVKLVPIMITVVPSAPSPGFTSVIVGALPLGGVLPFVSKFGAEVEPPPPPPPQAATTVSAIKITASTNPAFPLIDASY